jgi:transposase-like protein
MPSVARKSDGRRIFTDAFKRTQIDRIRRGELTISELSRKHGIARSLLQRSLTAHQR